MSSEIRVISSMATRALLAELAQAWQERGGTPVVVESVGGVDAARRVAAGEPFDVVVLASDAIDRLAEGGHVIPASKADLVRSGVAIAVARGAPRPDVSGEAALRSAVLAAGSIAFSTGPSGVALQRLFERWGVAQTLQSRLVQAPPGVPVGELVARGEAELGFQQLSELMHLEGIDVLGPMPPGLEIITTFSAAHCAASQASAEQHRPLLDFWCSAAADEAKRRHGMAPAQG
jgi:molybdate transport system substrate-binding protein